MSAYSTKSAKPNLRKYMEGGIHIVNLEGVRYGISPNGNPFLEYTYKNKQGQLTHKTEYPVKAYEGKKNLTEEETKSRNGLIATQSKRMLMPASLFLDEEELFDKLETGELVAKEFESFEEYGQWIANTLTRDKFENIDLRLKVVRKGKWFTTPDYVASSMPWIQRLDRDIESTPKMEIIIGKDDIFAPKEEEDKTPRKSNSLLIDDGSIVTDEIPTTKELPEYPGAEVEDGLPF